MENRIKRLEAVIVMAGLNDQSDAKRFIKANDTPSPDTSNVADRLSSLLIGDEGSSNYLGKC